MNYKNINKNEELKDLGNSIKRIRHLNKLSQEDLSEITGLHRTYIGMIERGERNPTYLTVLTILNSLNVSISFLENSNE